MTKKQKLVETAGVILITTNLDKHGERVDRDFLEEMAKQIRQSGKIPGAIEHDISGKQWWHHVKDVGVRQCPKGEFELFAVLEARSPEALEAYRSGRHGISLSWLGETYVFHETPDFILQFDPHNFPKEDVVNTAEDLGSQGVKCNTREWHRKSELADAILLLIQSDIGQEIVSGFWGATGGAGITVVLMAAKCLLEKARGPKKTLILEGNEQVGTQRLRVQIIVPEEALTTLLDTERRRQEALTVLKASVIPPSCTKAVLKYNFQQNQWDCKIY